MVFKMFLCEVSFIEELYTEVKEKSRAPRRDKYPRTSNSMKPVQSYMEGAVFLRAQPQLDLWKRRNPQDMWSSRKAAKARTVSLNTKTILPLSVLISFKSLPIG